MDFVSSIKAKAKQAPKRIVLPEGTEARTLQAADRIIEEGLAELTIIGNIDEINKLVAQYNLKNIEKATLVDPQNIPNKQKYIDLMVELRGKKGVTPEVAEKQLQDPLYLGAIMVKAGDVDGEVGGADNATGDLLRPALQYVKTLPGISVVSGAFIMITEDKQFGENGMMVFADCAVLPNPNAQELAQIAVATAGTARAIAGFEPRIAMLGFSTKGSAKHEMVDKVVEATKIAQEMAPDTQIDGELQSDAALIPSVANKKAPGSAVAGKANVLVFPSLEVGNIAYKLVQRIAHAEAIGPVLQGMAAPINDLSRGCSIDDIVNLVAITVCQAQAK
ncbi:MAG: phosphate acetyltransferase [Tidjanibacter sp.]|nr:phosphate acetyltransferase [Tidjanibacter sp.]